MQAFASEVVGILRAGSAALDLAYLASGRLDGFWEMGLKIWDMAAGVLLIKEAGGIVADNSSAREVVGLSNFVGQSAVYESVGFAAEIFAPGPVFGLPFKNHSQGATQEIVFVP